jgi:hypothetical protein
MIRLCYVCGAFGMLFLMWSCKSAKSIPTAAETALVTTAIEQQRFRIESDWAYPQASSAMQQIVNSRIMQPGSSANSISLIGNSNFLTVSGDSISSFLPYFGERQMQIAYDGSDSAIQFNGIMEDYTITKNKKSRYIIKFNAKSNTESFKVIITILPNATADMQVIGSSRFSIAYSGKLKDTHVE